MVLEWKGGLCIAAAAMILGSASAQPRSGESEGVSVPRQSDVSGTAHRRPAGETGRKDPIDGPAARRGKDPAEPGAGSALPEEEAADKLGASDPKDPRRAAPREAPQKPQSIP
jgi:hypothetical protein